MSEGNGQVEGPVFKAHEDPEPISIDFGGGKIRHFTLHELEDGVELAKWMRAVSNRIQTDRRGKLIKRDFEGMHADLISRCLKENGQPVPLGEIKSWGAKIQNYLFDRAQIKNGLNDQVEAAEGKD